MRGFVGKCWFLLIAGWCIGATASSARASPPQKERRQDNTVEVDVAIIGGGATGTYAAVRLREDFQKTVAVIEKDIKLGGHVHTYNYEVPGEATKPINFGVQFYLDRPNAEGFFNRLGFDFVLPEIGDVAPILLNPSRVDFNTGVKSDYPSAEVSLQSPGELLKYYELVEQYAPFFENGYHSTEPIPDDLLLPFKDFLVKNECEAAMSVLRPFTEFVDVMATPTFFVMSVLGKPQLGAIGLDLLAGTFKVPAGGSNQAVFDAAATLLGDDVLFNSTVVDTQRDDSANITTLTVQTSTGQRTIKAKKLLITMAPTQENLAPLNLDEVEAPLLAKFDHELYYVAVVNNTGLQDAQLLGILDGGNRVDFALNAPDDPDNLYCPRGAFVDEYFRTGAGDAYSSRIIGPKTFTAEEAQSMALGTLNQMKAAGTYAVGSPSLIAFAPHGPGNFMVSPEDLKAGFYQNLYALQGRHNTFWTGLAWAPDYSPVLWDFTETLFPAMVEGLSSEANTLGQTDPELPDQTVDQIDQGIFLKTDMSMTSGSAKRTYSCTYVSLFWVVGWLFVFAVRLG